MDNSFAWALAFAPLVGGLLAAVLLGAGWAAGSVVGLFASVAVNVALSVADRYRLRAAGFDLVTWPVFLVPVYLFQRQARLRQNYAIPVVWCLTFLLSLVGISGVGFNGGVQIDDAALQQQIQSTLAERTGTTFQVVCPSVTVPVGQSFTCTAIASDGSSVSVLVTVENSSGYVVWRVAN